MEIWDAYNEDGSLAGCDLVRGQPIPAGLFHLVCEVLVRHEDGDYLLMQRDFNKEGFPGLFEATASGSALKGENAEQAAIRELFEETGVTAHKLTPIYRTVNKNRDTIYCGFLCVTDCEKSSVTLQPGETISYKWMPMQDFMSFMKSDEYVSVHRERLGTYFTTQNEKDGE